MQKARSQQAHQGDPSSDKMADCSKRVSLGLDCILAELHDGFSMASDQPAHLFSS